MARNTKFNCIEEYSKSKGMKFYEFPNDKDPKSYVVIWTTDIKNFWSFFEDMVWVNKINNKTAESGVWECEGTKGFSVISETNNKIWKTSDPTWKPYEKPTADPENLFACIENHFKARGVQIETYSDSREVNITPTSVWSFYRPNSDNRQRWIEFENGIVTGRGEWKCDGDENFIIIGNVTKRDGTKKNQTYNSKDDKWIDTVQTTPTTGIDPVFSCIKAYYDSKGRKLTPQKGGYVTATTIDGAGVWVYSKGGKWSQYNKSTKKIDFTGKWECTGTASFSIISDDRQQWLSSDELGWVDIAEPTTEPPTEPTTGGGGFTWKDVNLTIEDLKSGKTVSMGMRGPVIGEIQKLLIGKGYKDVSKSGEHDNMFGRLTKDQVEKFQSENKDDKGEQLKKDGIVGQKTINALLKVPTPNTRGVQAAFRQYADKKFPTTLD